MVLEILHARIILDAQIIPFGRKEGISTAYSQLDKISELTLPYLNKKDTINKDLLKPISSDDDLSHLRAVIAERKKKDAETREKDGLPK